MNHRAAPPLDASSTAPPTARTPRAPVGRLAERPSHRCSWQPPENRLRVPEGLLAPGPRAVMDLGRPAPCAPWRGGMPGRVRHSSRARPCGSVDYDATSRPVQATALERLPVEPGRHQPLAVIV